MLSPPPAPFGQGSVSRSNGVEDRHKSREPCSATQVVTTTMKVIQVASGLWTLVVCAGHMPPLGVSMWLWLRGVTFTQLRLFGGSRQRGIRFPWSGPSPWHQACGMPLFRGLVAWVNFSQGRGHCGREWGAGAGCRSPEARPFELGCFRNCSPTNVSPGFGVWNSLSLS